MKSYLRTLRYVLYTLPVLAVALLSISVSMVLLPVEVLGLLLTYLPRLLMGACRACLARVDLWRTRALAAAVEAPGDDFSEA